MLMRCAARMMTGMVFAGGLAAGLALGAGAAGAALLAKRLYEERQGWRSGAGGGDDLPGEPSADAPSA
jgi:hypothetical protein